MKHRLAGSIFVLSCLLCLGCKHSQTHSFAIKVIAIEQEEDLIGKWSFSSHWSGHMGIALELKEDGTFDYWNYSDLVIGKSPNLPIQGNWELVKGALRLEPNDRERLYANDWLWIEYEEHTGLFDAENLNALIWHKATPDTRMLYKNDDASRWPMLNMPSDTYWGGGQLMGDAPFDE